MNYSFDTSSFVQPWWNRYPPNSFPGFWDNMAGLIKQGSLRAIEEVQIELERQDDDLVAWLKERDEVFIEIDEPIQAALKTVMAAHRRLVDTRKGRSGADPWVIALAMVNEGIVVTEEKFSDNLKKPRIPDVCRALDVQCIGILDVIKREGWVFK